MKMFDDILEVSTESASVTDRRTDNSVARQRLIYKYKNL